MSTPFQRKLATVAQEQYASYRFQRENQSPLLEQIERYWTETGHVFAGVEPPWSAVFVSWCVKQAGATAAQFKFSARHSAFVYEAIKNADQPNSAFRGRPVSTYPPKLGDILQNNRAGNRFDFAYASQHSGYVSHSAIVMEVGTDNHGRYLRTIGGNESDSVGMKEVRLDGDGLVINLKGLYISVLECAL
ncbi:DUF2272 domain-containing protein [uncultured Variovorax sp.]|uniref:DUF2272 domain-containing protein n=1 Tax=uncultured Variovorax sp. TaxID=114708 RepID=UPI0025F9E073|nr:DUF2272 domain-containing protein [uncultured Variovorax sp.]